MSESITTLSNQITPRTLFDGDDSARWIQRRFNNGAFIPPRTQAVSGTFIGGRNLHGMGSGPDTRGLSSQRGLPDHLTKTGRVVATGMCEGCGCGCGGGSKVDIRHLSMKKNYGYSDRTKNLVGSDPRTLGVMNEALYTPDVIIPGSEDARINEALHEPAESLADRILGAGGFII